MAQSKTPSPDPVGRDIAFVCPQCSKNLVIDFRAAGLKVNCPDCRAEIQVPIPAGVDLAEIDTQLSADAAGTEVDALREQVRSLKLEVDELRFRRQHLEKKAADGSQGREAIYQQLMIIRAAVEEIETNLQQLRDKPADATQPINV